ncbi:hypothetical protein [Isorropodon fossajaponicum symbiont]|uniref:hypothetical protein n=1 Tax=Isorropodon fossajaponicum symbiont TaxID=883811 RepID=UPI001915B325|nr:hypothetical protein [Isorropodon fossajaponicum symbiont]
MSKFSRMQDMFVDKLLPLFLKQSGEIQKTAIDNLHRLERLNIINNTDNWVDMRLLAINWYTNIWMTPFNYLNTCCWLKKFPLN